MNTLHTTRRSTALAATTLALLFAGATACGTEDGTAPASRPQKQSVGQHYAANLPSSIDLIEKAKQSPQAHRPRPKGEQPNHARPAQGFGDDRRQQQAPAPGNTVARAHHAPGYDQALLGEK